MENTYHDLKELFVSKLESRLEAMSSMRKKVLIAYVKFGVVFIALLILFNSSSSDFLKIILGIVCGVIAIRLYMKANHLRDSFRALYKREIVREVVKLIDPDWTYLPNKFVSSKVYNESDLFNTRCDRYSGDDLVYGQIDKTDFECSELHTEYKTTTRDSDGNTTTRWNTIFKGLFFHADFNKHFNGQTFVKPDIAEQVLGGIGTKFQRLFNGDRLVKLENREFEKLFIVKSNDQIEARYILTPAIMEAMVRLHKRYGRNISFSFTGSRVYCVLHSTTNLFEPNIIYKDEFNDILFMHEMFQLNRLIIEELNLNTRIWTKE